MGFINTAMVCLVVFTATCDMGDCQRRRMRTNPLGPLLQSLLGSNGGPCQNEDIVSPANLVASLLQNPQLRKNLNLIAQPRFRQSQPCQEPAQTCVDVPQRVIVNQGCSGPRVNAPIQQISLPYQNVPAPCQNILVPAPNFVVPTPNIPVSCMEKSCACIGSFPQALVNPFLPAASPVSAIAPPTSNLLPPANLGQCRCNFLRKIPIPPPSL